jgi:uncharacterized damage-inducible protein DinB
VTEAWLRGPVSGVDPLVMPAVHALMQASDEITRAAPGLTPSQLWATPGGAGSVGFHLRHITRSIDRLLTYAHGQALTPQQFAKLREEAIPGDPPAEAAPLVDEARSAIKRAIAEIKATPVAILPEPRTIGRAALPTTLFGLLFHIGEHTERHAGQIVTLSKVVRG